MTDLPSNEDLERIVGNEPRAILARLPESEKRSRAIELVNSAEKLAHAAREEAPPPS